SGLSVINLIFAALREKIYSSLKYRSPPSQSTVTTIAGSRNDAATRQAAKTLAPELGPTSNPSSRANLLVINNASSVATSSVSATSDSSKIPGVIAVAM